MTDGLSEANRDPDCPGPKCPMCSGEICNLCGAGCWDYQRRHRGESPCEHDTAERHADPVFGK
jgi:hypothetical protein